MQHSPCTTVGEALWISARLRFGREVDNATVRAFIAEVRVPSHIQRYLSYLIHLPFQPGQRPNLTSDLACHDVQRCLTGRFEQGIFHIWSHDLLVG